MNTIDRLYSGIRDRRTGKVVATFTRRGDAEEYRRASPLRAYLSVEQVDGWARRNEVWSAETTLTDLVAKLADSVDELRALLTQSYVPDPRD